MVKNKEYVISKEKILEGIKLCFDKADEIIDSIMPLSESGWSSPNVIVGLVSYSLEEFGKGLMLKDIMSKDDKNEYTIPRIFFRTASSHYDRIQRGLEEMPEGKRDFYPDSLNELERDPEIIKEKKDNTITYKIPSSKIDKFRNLNGIIGTTSSTNNPEFLPSTTSDFDIRMLCFHVDWDEENKKWKTGVPHEENQLNTLISELQTKIKEHQNQFKDNDMDSFMV